MAFWSGEKLSGKGEELVEGFNSDLIDCNSITLTVGAEYYKTADYDSNKKDPSTVQRLEQDEMFAIPPGQFAFLITKEKVKIPNDAMAFISIRSRKKFDGLINVSGFHVDPGYSGKLIFSVFNAGSNAIKIKVGEPLFLIWFADLDQEAGEDYRKSDKDGKTSITPDLIKGFNSPILSLQSLSDEIHSIEKKMTVQGRLFGTGVAFASATLLLVIGVAIRAIIFPPLPSDDKIRAEIDTVLEEKIGEFQNILDQQKTEVEQNQTDSSQPAPATTNPDG